MGKHREQTKATAAVPRNSCGALQRLKAIGLAQSRHLVDGSAKDIANLIERFRLAGAEAYELGDVEKATECAAVVYDSSAQINVIWSSLWCLDGMPSVSIDAPLAASIMCTSVPGEYVEEIRSPWRAFLMRVPPGLLFFECIEKHEIVTANQLVVSFLPSVTREGHVLTIMMLSNDSWTTPFRGGSMKIMATNDLSDQRPELSKHSPFEVNNSSIDKRSIICATRLAIGAIVELSCHRYSVAIEKHRALSVTRRQLGKLPMPCEIKASRPVRVNLADTVVQFVRTGDIAKPLSTQHLVRGHWKMQPCGTGKTGRKYIHVEPYWRGPNDAPVLVRSHQLSHSAGEQAS
jgi:hypothetical protein